ncbi:MAG: ComEA family DNA-binding protein [Armatimonadota bacterium]|jgi:competence protein ComEA
MFSWTRGQQVVAVGATVAIVAAGAYIGARRLRTLPQPAESDFFTEPADTEDVGRIMVHVSGEVATPGTYYVAADARVQDAIWAAGGPSANAHLAALNLAGFLADGDKVTVPARSRPGAGDGPSGAGAPKRIDINRATARGLEQLPGIGPTLAEEIVTYRKRHGNFTRLEQLKRVPGIAEKKFEAIEPLITL